jgi:hypothetical protein
MNTINKILFSLTALLVIFCAKENKIQKSNSENISDLMLVYDENSYKLEYNKRSIPISPFFLDEMELDSDVKLYKLQDSNFVISFTQRDYVIYTFNKFKDNSVYVYSIGELVNTDEKMVEESKLKEDTILKMISKKIWIPAQYFYKGIEINKVNSQKADTLYLIRDGTWINAPKTFEQKWIIKNF